MKTLILAYVGFWKDAILHFTMPGSLRSCTVLRHVEDVVRTLPRRVQTQSELFALAERTTDACTVGKNAMKKGEQRTDDKKTKHV